MTTIIFDTLQYSKRAQDAGFTKEQAEFQAEEIAQFVETKIATKEDLNDLKKELKIDIETLKQSIEIAIHKQTARLGGMLAAAVAILTAVLKIWH